jgi:adenylyl cyclase-associated protein
VIFSSAITSCEIVNSKSVQIQSTGICPSFAIDKTDGCLVYLSAKGAPVSSFVTSKSTEMNVSWQNDETGEQIERPIPQQFVHKIAVKGGVVESQVSDIYH